MPVSKLRNAWNRALAFGKSLVKIERDELNNELRLLVRLPKFLFSKLEPHQEQLLDNLLNVAEHINLQDFQKKNWQKHISYAYEALNDSVATLLTKLKNDGYVIDPKLQRPFATISTALNTYMTQKHLTQPAFTDIEGALQEIGEHLEDLENQVTKAQGLLVKTSLGQPTIEHERTQLKPHVENVRIFAHQFRQFFPDFLPTLTETLNAEPTPAASQPAIPDNVIPFQRER